MKCCSMKASLRGLAVVVVSATVLLAVSAAFAGPQDDPAAKAKALSKLDDEWSAAAGKKDVELVASFYAEDAVAYPPNEPVAVGRSAAKKVWAAYFAEPTFAISWKTTHAEVAKSGELGFTSGTYEASYMEGDKKVVEKGKYLCNWKLQKDGTWKAVHDMWNTDAK